ncbi:hypothetical protein BDM02DRAFT_1572409 [Thelephora ganbajun]|uniref:Uncharacterized protein n=1 Tax=Thelephora ganbajun TaxID=370292 RepID=A0ACB6ZVA6_THEGA|nr:hypothetical protein BDM02DRAFT_1572409 [Thelephora ganbajun]
MVVTVYRFARVGPEYRREDSLRPRFTKSDAFESLFSLITAVVAGTPDQLLGRVKLEPLSYPHSVQVGDPVGLPPFPGSAPPPFFVQKSSFKNLNSSRGSFFFFFNPRPGRCLPDSLVPEQTLYIVLQGPWNGEARVLTALSSMKGVFWV